MTSSKALVAMSGGVDSSVAAFLALESGMTCAGATMLLCSSALPGCPDRADQDDALRVAEAMNLHFFVIDAQAQFRQQVVEPFVRSYEAGLTPNPCILCNRHLKFQVFLSCAQEKGYEKIITGHYAQIGFDPASGRYLLRKAVDKRKDQSYFLACLDQHQLAHALFPLGALTKEQVRELARQQGFLNARKRDSQDICFIPDGDYVRFLQSYTGKEYPPGPYLDLSGNILGRHEGAVRYTLGQRKGLGIALGAPAYVCRKDMDRNTVTLGPEEALYTDSLLAEDWNWIPFPALTEPMEVHAKTRSRQIEQPATVYPAADGRARVVFRQPQRAITPGQAVVLYQGELVVGSGTICQTG